MCRWPTGITFHKHHLVKLLFHYQKYACQHHRSEIEMTYFLCKKFLPTLSFVGDNQNRLTLVDLHREVWNPLLTEHRLEMFYQSSENKNAGLLETDNTINLGNFIPINGIAEWFWLGRKLTLFKTVLRS